MVTYLETFVCGFIITIIKTACTLKFHINGLTEVTGEGERGDWMKESEEIRQRA